MEEIARQRRGTESSKLSRVAPSPHRPKFHDHWTSRADSLAPGDEYDLVDEFAEMPGIRGWFGWIPDVG